MGGKAHGGQQSAQHGADEALGHVMTGEGNDHGQRENGQRAIFILLIMSILWRNMFHF